MHERRQYPRIHGPFRGTWQSAFNDPQVGILDISPGGCFVHGSSGPSPGERVQVSVTIQHRSVALVGTVIYTDGLKGFEVVFKENPPEKIEQLHQLLDFRLIPHST